MQLASSPLVRRPPPDPRSAPTVFVVDDDVSVRESLELLIRSAGWCPETFDSASAFLSRPRDDGPNCLLLDVSLPDVGGLELQKRMADDRRNLPIIFITGHADVPVTVRAMKAGAVEFLMKPFSDDILLTAVADAIEQIDDVGVRQRISDAPTRHRIRLRKRSRDAQARPVLSRQTRRAEHLTR